MLLPKKLIYIYLHAVNYAQNTNIIIITSFVWCDS